MFATDEIHPVEKHAVTTLRASSTTPGPNPLSGHESAHQQPTIAEAGNLPHPAQSARSAPSSTRLTAVAEGNMLLNGDSIYHTAVDVIELRKRMGMVFQKPNPFPMSIYENVVYSLRIDGERDRSLLDEVCERSLRSAALWDEVKEDLNESALRLSGGQQQRLCIARAIAAEPEVLLLDEPCSALDPIATGKIEDLIQELRGSYSV